MLGYYVPTEKMNTITTYLSKKPYAEVAHVMNALASCKTVDEVNEANKKKSSRRKKTATAATTGTLGKGADVTGQVSKKSSK